MRLWMTQTREALGLSIKEAAHKAGVSPGLLQDLEEGILDKTTHLCAIEIAHVYHMTKQQRDSISTGRTGKIRLPPCGDGQLSFFTDTKKHACI